MKLGYRDLVTTLLLGVAGILVYSKLMGYSWWLVGSWRGAVAVLGLLGLGICISSGGNLQDKSVFNRLMSYVGYVAFVLIVLGVIISSEMIFYTLAVVVGGMWLASTFRHFWNSMQSGHPRHANA